ncbi:MAG: hypothetical protein JWP35_3514 [Caulobacter sp.]|nr:hypothetical protein [Caulobacter sp.]
MTPDRTAPEVARMSETANELVKLLHNAWGAIDHRGGPMLPADFIEATSMALAGLTAGHLNPAGNVTQQIAASVEIFARALRVEVSAARGRGALP